MPSTTSSADFFVVFRDLKAEILSDLDANSVDLPDINQKIGKLRRALNDVLPSLPGYDQRNYDLQLKDLELQIAKIKALQPKKSRFAFAKASSSKDLPKAAESSTSSHQARTTNTISPDHCVIHGCQSQYIDSAFLQDRGSESRGLSLSDLTDCVVNLSASVELISLHARKFKHCVLFAPKMSGSVMMSDIVDSVIIVGCQQYRMHSSKDSEVFIKSDSTPVIEDCKGIQFGPYPVSNSSIVHQSQIVVDDFDWVRNGPSPNWKVVEGSRIEEIHCLLSEIDYDKAEQALRKILDQKIA